MDQFSLNRIKLSEIFTDTYDFLRSMYNTNKKIFTEASPFGQILSVINKLFGMLLYYIEDSASELNIFTAYRSNSIKGLAALTGYDSARALTARGALQLSYSGNLVLDSDVSQIFIPNKIKLINNNNNLNYILLLPYDTLAINVEDVKTNPKTVQIFQGELKSQSFTGTGEPLQSFEVNVTEDQWIEQNLIDVYVNGSKCRVVKSLYDMPLNSNCCMIRTGITSGIDIIFGDGNFGSIPDYGANIEVDYILTDGYAGNLELNSDNEFSFQFQEYGYDINDNEIDLNSFFKIDLITPITLGSLPEDLNQIKKLAPTQSQSFVLAQTSNYESYFKRMNLFSTIDIYTKYDKYDPYVDNIIYAFLIPDVKVRLGKDIDYFLLDNSMFELTDYEKFNLYKSIDESGQKLFGTILKFVDPIFRKFGIKIDIKIWSNYNESTIKSNIQTKISDYLLNLDRTDQIPKSDIIAIIEGVDGVNSVDSIEFFDENSESFLEYFLDEDNVNYSYWTYVFTDTRHSDFSLTDLEKLKLNLFYADDIMKSLFKKVFQYCYQKNNGITSSDMNYISLDSLYEDANSINSEYGDFIDDWISLIIYNDLKFYEFPFFNECTYQQKLNYLLSIDSIKKYYETDYDSYGNIKLSKSHGFYPMFRGGFYDRLNNFVSDNISVRDSSELGSNEKYVIDITSTKVSVENNTIPVNYNQLKS